MEPPLPDAPSQLARGSLRDRRPLLRSRWWAAGAAAVAGLALTGCELPAFGAYRGDTTQGQEAFKLWQGFFIAGAVIFLLVLFLILWSVLRYRRRSDSIPPQTQYHTLFEIVYTILPIVIVLVLFGFTFVTENNVDAVTTKQVTVNVTAFQWGWEFQYPNYDVKVLGVETQDPVMVIPANEQVRIYLRSADVIHGFYVPQFNFSRYAQPGVTNQFNLDVIHPGTYRGQCTQFCGLYHSLMFFQVKAVTPAQFQAWVQQQQSQPSTSTSVAKAKAKAGSGGYRSSTTGTVKTTSSVGSATTLGGA
ncbi:MAG TPA: cytochrome c oxidase subunit II [Acidimicrobiales bacterium]|nr:cytochrome c oxidase subunit II [Acidimicrobiales bacterium]